MTPRSILLSLLPVLVGVSLVGCSKPVSKAGGNAPVDESKFPERIGPPSTPPEKVVLPPQKTMTKDEQIAEVKRRNIPPMFRQRMIQEIRKQHGEPPQRKRSSP